MTFISAGVPLYSATFGNSLSLRRLEVSDANFGAFDRDKFSVSFWFKPNSNITSGAPIGIFTQWHSSNNAQKSWRIGFNRRTLVSGVPTGLYKLAVITRTASGQASKVTGAVIPSSGSTWTHCLVHFDMQNATAANRIKIYIDGSLASVTGTNPAQESVNNSEQKVMAGAYNSNSPTGYLAGRLYGLSFYSGILPTAAQTFLDSTTPLQPHIPGDPHSLLNADNAVVEEDWALGTNWTNIASVARNDLCPQQP